MTPPLPPTHPPPINAHTHCLPGRLLHHLAEVSGFKLSGVEVVVFDEADRMFEMGFAEQVSRCCCCTPVAVPLLHLCINTSASVLQSL